MALEVQLQRNAGHPWDSRPGFDLMMIVAGSDAEIQAAAAEAKRKHWEPWLIGVCEANERPAGVFYKPCGVAEPWKDSPKNPHPGILTK